MPDRWLDVSVRKVLRPTTSIHVFFLGFPVSWKQMLRWFPNIQDVTTCFSCSPHADVNVNFSSTVSSTCICVQNRCHRAKSQLQLNKYYYYYKCTAIDLQSKFRVSISNDPLFTIIEPKEEWHFSKASKLLFYITFEHVFYIISIFFARY